MTTIEYDARGYKLWMFDPDMGLNPTSDRWEYVHNAYGELVQQTDATNADFLYFSFITLTTVGYGDLTAADNLGRSVAVLEALTGQVYLVTIVALLVGNLVPRRSSGRGDDEAPSAP